jgi:hypothetical protein
MLKQVVHIITTVMKEGEGVSEVKITITLILKLQERRNVVLYRWYEISFSDSADQFTKQFVSF